MTLALAGPGGCARLLPAGVVYPSITPDGSSPETVTREFVFEGDPVTLTVTVDMGVYQGAAAAEKSVIRFGSARETDWIEEYYPAFVNETHQEPFYTSALEALRRVRDTRGLDQDRYAELITVFVQSLTYETDPVDLSPKFPIETFVEGSGDCDDKSLLLAGLLAREGYDVAIMLFEPEQHVAVGIRSADVPYRNTGYAYIETTAPGYIGMVPETLAGGTTLASEPRVFRIDGGATAYTAGDEVRAILDARERALAEATTLAKSIERADEELARLEADTRAASAELEALRDAGRIAEYNARVPAYNELAERYNARVRERNALADRYNDLVALERTIVEGFHDRRGTYGAVVSRAGSATAP